MTMFNRCLITSTLLMVIEVCVGAKEGYAFGFYPQPYPFFPAPIFFQPPYNPYYMGFWQQPLYIDPAFLFTPMEQRLQQRSEKLIPPSELFSPTVRTYSSSTTYLIPPQELFSNPRTKPTKPEKKKRISRRRDRDIHDEETCEHPKKESAAHRLLSVASAIEKQKTGFPKVKKLKHGENANEARARMAEAVLEWSQKNPVPYKQLRKSKKDKRSNLERHAIRDDSGEIIGLKNIDCSNLQKLFGKLAGVPYPENSGTWQIIDHHTGELKAKEFKAVDQKDIKRGDLIIFNRGFIGNHPLGHIWIVTKVYQDGRVGYIHASDDDESANAIQYQENKPEDMPWNKFWIVRNK